MLLRCAGLSATAGLSCFGWGLLHTLSITLLISVTERLLKVTDT